jgi:hypothetical protein
LSQDGGERAQAGRAGQLAGLFVERDPAMLLEREEDGALDVDFLGVGGGEAVEGVFGVGAEGAESSGEVDFAVLPASEVGGEACEVASGGAVVAFGLVLQWAGFAFGQPGAEEFLWLRGFMACVLRCRGDRCLLGG